MAGQPRTASSATDAAEIAAIDSPPIALLRADGWAPVALTRSHEHGWGITTRAAQGGGARNPHDPSRIAGGSSGGSAVTVAVGAVPLAVGSDTAGSVRIPAAFCGVIGMKPTWDAVGLDGCQALAPSLDTAGLLGTDAEVIGHALRAWGLSTTHGGTLRVGLVDDPTLPALRPDLATVIDTAARALETDTLIQPPAAADVLDVFALVQMREALTVHRDILRTWPDRRDDYGADVATRLVLAERSRPPADLDLQRERLRDRYLEALADVDVLVLPVAACGPSTVAAPDIVAVNGTSVPLRELVIPFTAPASLFGLPAASVPAGRDRDGLPVGIQVVGKPGAEAAVLAAVRRCERALSMS